MKKDFFLKCIIAIEIFQFIACTKSAFDIQEDVDLELIPVRIGDNWGYIEKNGQIVINPIFSDADFYRDGLARVQFNGKVGYINKSGEFEIQAIYEEGTQFVDGLAFVSKENSPLTCIAKNGKEVFQLPVNIESVDAFSKDGVALIQATNGKFGYINKKGDIIVDTKYGVSSYDNCSEEGMMAVQSENGKWGFFNIDGEMVVNPQFDAVGQFSYGLAYVCQDNKYGYIDKKGQYVINPQFDLAGMFSSNGLASVKQGKRFGYINTKGEYVINPQTGCLDEFYNGFATIVLGNKYGTMNSNGEYVINPQFDVLYPYSKNGLARFKLNNKWGYVNKEGTIVVNPQFDNASDFQDNIAFVESNDKWGIIDEQGKYIVNPQFDNIRQNFVIYSHNERIHSNSLRDTPITDEILYLNSVLNDTYANTVGLNDRKGWFEKNTYVESGLPMPSPIKNETAEMEIKYVFDRRLRDIDESIAKFVMYISKVKIYKNAATNNIDGSKVVEYAKKIMSAIEEKEKVKFESLDNTWWSAENQSIYVLVAIPDEAPQMIEVLATKVKGAAHQLKININNDLRHKKSNVSENNEYGSTTTNNQQSDIDAQSINDAPTNSNVQNNTNGKITIPGDYPDASIRILSSSELRGYSKRELKLMRNEIFARHGYIFKTDEMKKHFSSKQWYEPKYNDVNSMLTDIEQQNIKTIQQLEK